MAYGLASGVTFVVVNGRAIFLDIGRDRYFALPAALDAAFQVLVTEPTRAHAEEPELERLVKQGVLVNDSTAPAPVAACIAVPDKSALDEPLPRVGASAVGAALAVQAITAMRLRAQPLAATLKALRRRKVIQARRPDGKAATRARRCAAAFVRSNLLFSSRDRCLLRALALCEHVIGDGGEAALIFGVKLPFAAHCWAQSQDMVLSDPWDIVADYTPILAV